MASLSPGRAAARPGPLRPLLPACLVALALLTGCGDDGDETTATANGTATPSPSRSEVRVELDDRTVRSGETITAALVNESEMEVTYGADYTLERRVSKGEFERFPIRPEPIPDIGLVAPPGGTGPEVEIEVPESAEPGIYRVILNASVQDGQPAARFRVR